MGRGYAGHEPSPFTGDEDLIALDKKYDGTPWWQEWLRKAYETDLNERNNL